MRVFLTSTSANKHVLFALGSHRTGRDNVKISQVGLGLGLEFIRVKSRETNIQQMLYIML